MELEAVKELLNQHNFRLTVEREHVLQSFMRCKKMVTPTQLCTMVQQEQAVGLTTVYRLVDTLTKLGVATPFLLGGEVFYAFCPDSHHHHFICLECHRVQDIFECPPMPDVAKYGSAVSHKMDVFGYCRLCS